MRGFFIGRFQPFHLGHRRFLEAIADEVDSIIVGVGSAQASHTVENPFTAGERVSLIHRSIIDLEPTTYTIPIEDIDRYAVWVSHVRAMCPPFDVVYSNNPLVQRLFREAGYEIESVGLVNRDEYRGTAIREKMIGGEPWRDLVPDPVADGITAIDGVARLTRLSRA
jgi:nicotinamide-nucleotide adenylyltransferase